MAPKLSKRMNRAASGGTTSSSGFGTPDVPSHKYYLVQETDRSEETLLKVTLNEKGNHVNAEMPDESGFLRNAFVRWHHLRSDLSKSAFQEISETAFNDRMKSQFTETYGSNVLKFSDPSI